MQRAAIGIDVGGTGIKGAVVDPATGARLTKRRTVATPLGGHPDAIAAEVRAMTARLRAELSTLDLGALDRGAPDLDPTEIPIGVTLPGVVRHGIMYTAANIDTSWIGTDAATLMTEATGAPCTVLNDADAAGIAETALGAAAGLSGFTMVLTFGTGIGTAAIYDGVLVPGFELGHLHLDGHTDIEQYVTPRNIALESLTLDEWAARAARYVQHVEAVLNPDRFVIGGGISRDADKFLPFAGVRTEMLPARFRNSAGIVGAAWLASRTR